MKVGFEKLTTPSRPYFGLPPPVQTGLVPTHAPANEGGNGTPQAVLEQDPRSRFEASQKNPETDPTADLPGNRGHLPPAARSEKKENPNTSHWIYRLNMTYEDLP